MQVEMHKVSGIYVFSIFRATGFPYKLAAEKPHLRGVAPISVRLCLSVCQRRIRDQVEKLFSRNFNYARHVDKNESKPM